MFSTEDLYEVVIFSIGDTKAGRNNSYQVSCSENLVIKTV